MNALKSISKLVSSIFVIGLLLYSCNQKSTNDNLASQLPSLTGPYLGQKLPGTKPEIFAPGIVSTGLYERDLTMTPDGKEIYFSVLLGAPHNRAHIVGVKEVDGVWSKPEIAPFSNEYGDIEPFIQPDGQKMYFISKRPLIEGKDNKYTYNMWYVNKTENGWSKAIPVGEPINGHGSVFYPSLTKSGSLYFSRKLENKVERIFRSKIIDGAFTEPELLPEVINSPDGVSNTLISPDEDFMIIPQIIESENYGGGDYYVSFRNEDDNWSELINLGAEINSPAWDYCPALSPDGKYFFFQRDAWTEDLDGKILKYEDLLNIHNGGGDIYWVDAKVITDLNPYHNSKL